MVGTGSLALVPSLGVALNRSYKVLIYVVVSSEIRSVILPAAFSGFVAKNET